MKRMIIAAGLAAVTLCGGCWTPRQVERCRVNRQRQQVVHAEARVDTVFAGVDVYGVKEALQDDPGGTTAALTKDGLLTLGIAAMTAFVASGEAEAWLDKAFGSDDDSKASQTPKNGKSPASIYADSPPQYLIYGSDNDVTAPGASGPVVIWGSDNQFDATATEQASP